MQTSKTELLTIEEETALVKRAQQGDPVALQRVCTCNSRFVYAMARRFKDEGLSFDELITAGNQGLATAVMKYDPSKGYKLISFAVWFIRHAILAEINKCFQGKDEI